MQWPAESAAECRFVAEFGETSGRRGRKGIVSVFSNSSVRPAELASDPQREVVLDQTPLGGLATTACLRRRTTSYIRRLLNAMQLSTTSEVAYAFAASVPL